MRKLKLAVIFTGLAVTAAPTAVFVICLSSLYLLDKPVELPPRDRWWFGR